MMGQHHKHLHFQIPKWLSQLAGSINYRLSYGCGVAIACICMVAMSLKEDFLQLS